MGGYWFESRRRLYGPFACSGRFGPIMQFLHVAGAANVRRCVHRWIIEPAAEARAEARL